MALPPRERREKVSENIIENGKLGLDQYGHPVYVIFSIDRNPIVYRVTDSNFKAVIIDICRGLGFIPSKRDVEEIRDIIRDNADASGNEFVLHNRVAESDGVIEIDSGQPDGSVFRLEDGEFRVIKTGSTTLFYKSKTALPFVIPSTQGSLNVFNYLNMDEGQKWLLLAWLCYTISTPKFSNTPFPILVLIAEQGAAKTTTCKTVIRNLVDPSRLGVQGFPKNRQDMVLGSKNCHVLIYDNLRIISPGWADTMCIASTGGSDPTRRLFTDEELVSHEFQSPLVLNGIHDFITEPDLAQRCLKLQLKPIPESNRLDEKELNAAFMADLPDMLTGILQLAAMILARLDSVEVINRERMVRFVKYIAAIEAIYEKPKGELQGLYSKLLNDAQQDAVLENPMAAMLFEMMQKELKGTWSGTPTELLIKLRSEFSGVDQRARLLPQNPISLSKQLRAVTAPLRSQGIDVKFHRGKERLITITNEEKF